MKSKISRQKRSIRIISSVGCSAGMWWCMEIQESIRHCEISWLLCWTSCAGLKLGKE